MFDFAAGDNFVNVSSILALGGEDVVNGNVSVFVHDPDSGMGTVVEIAYNIDKLIVGMNEYIEGVGKIVFTVLTEE
jgi:hypothetical protein